METVWSELIRQVNALLTPVREVVVVLRSNPNLDSLASGLALKDSLKKIGRRVSLVCPSGIPNETEKLRGSVEILSVLPQNQIEITINYKQGSLVRIETKKETKSLQLNLLPEPNQLAIDPSDIDYRQFQSQPEVVILLELENLAHLQDFYNHNQAFFNQTPLINIDFHANNARYGRVNLIDSQASSISEMVTLMLYDLRLPIDKDSAHNLYQGIGSQTNNFDSSRFSANLLEAASICLRHQKAASPPLGVTPSETSPKPPVTAPVASPVGPTSWPQATSAWPKE